jgi:hypothetical protein
MSSNSTGRPSEQDSRSKPDCAPDGRKVRIVLDAGRDLDWTVANMKTKFFAVIAGMGLVLLATGCIHTVSGTRTPAMSFGEDRYSGRYERTPDQVYQAAVTVMNNNGVLLTEYIPHDNTNSLRSLYGKVNKQNVWISVQPVDLKITQVTVQARSPAGFRDQDLTHELEKQIALQLQSMR